MSSVIATIQNKSCTKCHMVYKEMKQLGTVVMCPECMAEEFTTENPIDLERDKYLSWLKVQDADKPVKTI